MADVPELELFDMEHNSQLHQFHRAHCTHAVWSPTIAGVRAPLGRRRPFYLCLWNVTDPSNLGALIRTAAGFGVDGVLIGPGCANPFYRKAIRASMGNVFVLPLWSVDVHGLEILDAIALENAINGLPGVVTVGLFANRGADVALIGTADGVKTIVK